MEPTLLATVYITVLSIRKFASPWPRAQSPEPQLINIEPCLNLIGGNACSQLSIVVQTVVVLLCHPLRTASFRLRFQSSRYRMQGFFLPSGLKSLMKGASRTYRHKRCDAAD